MRSLVRSAGGCSLALIGCGLVLGCAADVRRFPLQEPVWQDADLRPVSVPCRPFPDPDPDDPPEICMPEEYESPFAWDVADKTVFRPLTQIFAADVGFRAKNINSMDEIPDSSWFVNRIGRRDFPVEELIAAPDTCGEPLDVNSADGSWVIDMGKPNGANPGFRVRVDGLGKYMLKADPDGEGERATGATAIASRLYYAAGWWAACDTVVYVHPRLFKLRPGLEATDNSGVSKPFDQKALDSLLANAQHRGELVRMVASKWLPGRSLGPFRYEDTRDDDPNDVVPHEDRRDLRGARLIAAWLNHFDSREQNTMDVWLSSVKGNEYASPGVVRHYYIDLGDCFGSEWEWDEISRRLGHAYYLDLYEVGFDLLTLGIPSRPWDRAKRSEEVPGFGYFGHERFEPAQWKGGYPNPSFQRMDEGDGAWAARIIANFTLEHIEAAVRVADYTGPEKTTWLTHQLLERRNRILERYLSELSPLTEVKAEGDALCAVDLARRELDLPVRRFRYQAAVFGGAELARRTPPPVRPGANGEVCITLPHVADAGGTPDDHASRYVVVEITNGFADGPLRAHLYDLGPSRGFKLVGIERSG